MAIIARKNKLVRMFRNMGAIDSSGAIDISESGIGPSFLFNKMVSDGIFVDRGDNLFYLDEIKEHDISVKRKRIVYLLMFLMLLIILAGVYTSFYKS